MTKAAQFFDPTFSSISRCFSNFDKIENKKIPTVDGLTNLIEGFISENSSYFPSVTKRFGFVVDFFSIINVFFYVILDDKDTDIYESAKNFFEQMQFEGTLTEKSEDTYQGVTKPIMYANKQVNYKLSYIILEEKNLNPMLAFEEN